MVPAPGAIGTLDRSKRSQLSGIYFVTFLAFSAIVPYLALYYASLGFTGVQIGALLGVGPLVSLLATPFWTSLADSRNRHRAVLAGGILSLVFIYALFPALVSFDQILIAVALLALLSSHVLPLQDSAVMFMLGEQRDRYGRIRAWGTIGWGIGAPLFGVLYNVFGLGWMFGAISLVMLINLFQVRRLEFEQVSQTIPIFSGLRQLLRDSRWLLLFLAAFVAAIGLSAGTGYLALLLGSMGSQARTLFGLVAPASALVGIALALATMSELPIMLFSKPLILSLGDRGLLLTSLFVGGLRNLIYAFSASAWQILLAQLLHGFTFALLWLAGINYVAKHAPRGLTATTQGLFSTVLLGFGLAAGNLFNGLMMDLVGIGSMFAVSGAVVFLGLFIVFVLNKRIRAF
ncbi:MAG: MFS transporter [Anaerolineales bacterium]